MSNSKKASYRRHSARIRKLAFCGYFCVVGLLLGLMPNASLGQAPAAEPVAITESSPEPITCFDRIWQMAHDHPWYLDAEGRQIVPEVTHDWLIVRFYESSTTPQQMTDFYSRYPEAFDALVETPAAGEFTAAYRLRQELPYGLFDALLQRWRNDPQVHSIQPTWRIEQKLYAPLDSIELEWKTATNQQARRRLLAEAEALQGIVAQRPHTDRITVDPCRRMAWQTAALLVEDLYVARAVPLKSPLAPPVEIRFQLDRPGAVAGMPMPFSLEILFAKGIKIDAATIANLNLNPRGIFHNLYDISFDHPLSAVDLSRSPIKINGTLRIYASGDYQLPALPVYYTDRRTGDARPVTIRTAYVPIRIASMIPEGSEDYRLQVAAPVPIPTVADPEQSRRLQRAVTLSAIGLLLLVLGTIAWLRTSSGRASKAENMDQSRLEERHAALAHKLKSDPHTLQLDDWSELGGDLQAFLADYAGLSAAITGGSHGSFLPRLKDSLSDNEMRQAKTVLQGIEHLLAADHLDLEQRRSLLVQAEQLLADLTDRVARRRTDTEAS
ncbi:MAG: hypothetical protein BA870_10625 [Desulfuromonadales bacterium C00003094]|nr:MAG: hypothetical protein BA870_10625 [Desulfuromonadales bacterium C00003094]